MAALGVNRKLLLYFIVISELVLGHRDAVTPQKPNLETMAVETIEFWKEESSIGDQMPDSFAKKLTNLEKYRYFLLKEVLKAYIDQVGAWSNPDELASMHKNKQRIISTIYSHLSDTHLWYNSGHAGGQNITNLIDNL